MHIDQWKRLYTFNTTVYKGIFWIWWSLLANFSKSSLLRNVAVEDITKSYDFRSIYSLQYNFHEHILYCDFVSALKTDEKVHHRLPH